MSFSFPKEIIITEEFTLRDETGNSITFNTNGTASSATSAGGIVTRTVTDPKFTSSAFVDLLNEVFNAGFVLEDDEYLTTSVGRNVFLEKTGGSVNNFLSVLGNLNVTNNIDVSGNITSPGTLNIGSIVSSGQIQIGIGTLAITDKIDIDGGGYATNSTTEFKPISIGYECNITGGQNSTITLGNFSGRNDQKLQAIAIGNYAANIGQNHNSIAIGVESARNYQGTSSIAIGTYAGQNQQDNFTIALGENSGRNRQGEKSIAIGINSGFDNQLSSSISIGDSAGRNNQSSYSIAIGNESGKTSQQIKSIALGYYSASNNQSSNSIAIGSQAAENNQLSNSIAIGSYAGQNQQNINSIAIGNLSAQHNQSSESVAIGYASGSVNQGSYNVAIGRDSGEAYQATQSVAIGYHAGAVNQGLGVDNNYSFPGYSVAVGAEAGMTKQGNYSTALGYRAGGVNQGQLSVALGHDAGKETQGFNSVAVGVYSGENFQAQNCVSIGKGAARNNQQQLSIAIGLAAANTNQGSRCIAIGEYAGLNYQSQWSIAIGGRAARYNQATGSIAIGPYAGDNFQNTYSVSLGYESAIQNQSSKSIAIGYQSGKEFQNTKSIAIGNLAGKSYQSLSCVAVGDDSGSINQKQYSIAVGFESGKNNQGIPNSGDEGFSVAIGYKSGNFNQTTGAVAIGKNSGFTYQKRDCIAIGNSAGYQNQGYESISIGKNSGKTFQSTNAIAIGANSGENYQETECIAIGENAGITNQNRAAIAIGFQSGAKFQDTQSTAIGYKAGYDNQGDSAIAIGESAGLERQGDHSIAIGSKSGYKRLGTNSISIGQYSSGGANDIQPNNSISLNATGSEKPVSDSGSFYVNPVRNVVSDTNTAYAFIRYNWRNGEIFANSKHLDFGYTGSYNQKIRWNVTGVNSNLTSETGPNQIQLWSDARCGFGIENNGLKYHSNINHNFYYYSGGNPSTTNGTRVLQLNYSNAIVTGNIAANGVSSPSYPLDFNGISHAGAEGFHSGKIIYYDRLDTNNNLSEVSNDISTFDTQGQVRFTGGACEILGSGHIITNTYDFRNYFGHGYFDRTSQDIRDNSVNRGEISTRILLKLNANFYSHDSIDEFFKIELYDSNGSTLIDTLYVGCVTERNNPGYIPIVCDLTQYITNTQNQFRFKFSQTANGLGDYTFIKNFTICLDDSTSWYNFSTFNSNVINNLKIPVGTTTQRPTAVDSSHYGYIRYNTTTSSYEGFGAGNTWGSLGGIKDVDQDTYITAENSPGTDNDQLKFYTAGTEKMIINTNGDFGLNISNPTSKLHIYAINTTNTNNEPAIKLLTSNRFDNTSGSSWSLISINGTSHPNDYSGLTSNGNEEFEQVGINLINYNTSGSGQYGINSRSKTGIGFSVRHQTTLHENALAIKSDGNVGIGTTSPSEKLHVNGDIKTSTIILSDTGYSGHAGFMNNALSEGAGNYALLQSTSGNTFLNATDGKSIRFRINNSDKMILSSNGNVGIGTSSPSQKLHVDTSTTYDGIILYNGNNELCKLAKDTNNAGYFQLKENNSVKVRFFSKAGEDSFINNGGNFGIGTSSPNAKLHVNGNIKCSGDLTVSGNDIIFGNGESIKNTTNNIIDITATTTRLSGDLFLKKTGNDGGIIQAYDANHAIYIRRGYNQASNDYSDHLDFHEYGNIRFYTNGLIQNQTEKMRINQNGNVGIGTTVPSTKLHVGTSLSLRNDDATHGTNDALLIVNPKATSQTVLNDPQDCLILARPGTGSQSWAAQAHMRICRWLYSGTRSKTRLDFALQDDEHTTSGPATIMTMLSNGNVGIGNTNPSEKLSIGSGGNLQFNLDEDLVRDTTSAASALTYFKSKEQNIIRNANKHYRNSGDGGSLFDTHKIVLGYSDLNNMDTGSGGYYPKHHAIKFQMIPNWETGYDIVNNVYPAAGSIEPTTMMVINGDGNVGIGTESPNYNLDVSGDVHASGDVHFSGAIIGESTYSKRFNFYSNDTQQIELTLVGSSGYNNIYIELKVSAGAGNTSGAGTVHNYYLLKYYNTDVDANLIRSYKTPYGTTSNYHLASVSYVQSGTKIKIMVNPIDGYTQTVDGWIFVSIYSDGPTISASSHTTVTDAVTENSLVTSGRIALGGNVGIGTTTPAGKLHVSSGTAGDCTLILEADTDNNNEADTPRIEFRQDGGGTWSSIQQTEGHFLELSNASQDAGIIFKTLNTWTQPSYTNAIERMRIDGNGNVGIGTTSPSKTLHVAGTSIIGSGVNNITPTGVSNPSIQCKDIVLHNNSANDQMYIRRIGASEYQFQTYKNGSNNGEIHLQPYGGSVGIGTTAPEAQLELSKSGGTTLSIVNPDGTYADQNQSIEFKTNYATTGFILKDGLDLKVGSTGTNPTQGIKFYTTSYDYTGGTTGTRDRMAGRKFYQINNPFIEETYNSTTDNCQMIIDGNGNVGIGTTTPSYNLDVSGDINFTGTLYQNGSAFSGGGGGSSSTSGFSVTGGSTLNTTRSVGVHLGTLTGGNVGGTEHSFIELVSSNDNGSWIDFKDSSSGNADREGRIRYGYGGTINGLQFETAQTIRMHIGNNGNVGIGTTSPAAKLDVNGSVRSAYDTDTTSYFGRTAIGYGGGHSNFAFFSHISKSSDSGGYALKQNSGGGTYLNSASGKKIEFKINNQGKAVLDANGNFGIGTTGPQYKLHVIGEAFFNDTDAGSIRIHSNQINFEGINDQHNNDDYAYIGRTNNDLHIVNGNNYDNDVRIYAASHPVTYSGGSDQGRVVVRNLSNNSDDRIKHNEEIITNALSDIRQLTPKKYWKLDDVLYDENHNFDLDTNGYPIDSSGNRVPAYIEHGLIAQEVLNIDSFMPFVGKPRANQDNSTYSLEYSNIFVHSIAAIKELDAAHSVTKQELEAEKTKTASLETKVTSLETQLAAVLARLDAPENN